MWVKATGMVARTPTNNAHLDATTRENMKDEKGLFTCTRLECVGNMGLGRVSHVDGLDHAMVLKYATTSCINKIYYYRLLTHLTKG